MNHDTWGRGIPRPAGVPEAPLLPGSRLAERYEIVSELGRGGMGVVYRARDPVLGRDVAVKLITPSLLSPDIEQRFRREAQIVAGMDHPGVVTVFDFGRNAGSLFSVMPLLSGATLRQLVAGREPSVGDVLEIGAQVADALDYSHSRGIVHRDVKPENVMVSRDGTSVRARVMDFGLATAESQSPITQAGMLIGTLAYFSPEQIAARPLDGRADVYALGTVLYECLCGEPPFGGDLHTLLYRIAHDPPRPLRALGIDVDERLESLVLRCLEKDPARRPATAAEVATALRACRDDLDEEALRRPAIGGRGRARDRRTGPPFVGRDKERSLLVERLGAARSGACHLVLVAGEAGVGKTRLVEELERHAGSCGVRLLHARFAEHDQAFAYQGFYELIHAHCRDQQDGAPGGADLADLAEELLGLFPVLGELAAFRSAAARLRTGPTPRRIDDRTWIFELLARTVARIVGEQPTLLVLEDLQGAGVSLDALAYVVRRLSHAPVLMAGTYRSNEVDRAHPLTRFVATFTGDPRFELIRLGPLNASECGRLVESMVGEAAGSGLGARVWEATEGNPLFTTEVVRSLLESGGLARGSSGGWTLSAELALSAAELPATVQQVVAQRVERLPDEARDVLGIAAVLGRELAWRDLEALAPDARDLDRRVDELLREGLLEEVAGSREDRLAFANPILREVVYASLPARRRRSLHRRHADQLEQRHAGRLERVWPQLLHHFHQGDVPEKVVRYGIALARSALAALSAEEALRALRPVSECLADDTWTGEPGLEGELHRLLALAHRMAGSFEAAFREAEAAVRACERDSQPAAAVDAMLLAAEVAWQRRRVDDARRWLEAGLERARPLGPSPSLQALLSLSATVANLRGEHDRARELLAEVERTEPPAGGAAAAELPSGGRIVVGLAAPVAADEPWQIEVFEESEVLGQVFETLLASDGQGHLRGVLCESWEMRDGGRVLALRLRPDAAFSDGAPLRAGDVKAWFERVLSTPVGTSRAVWSLVERVEEASETSVELVLRQPLPFYPAMLADPSAAVARIARDGRVLGTGPFRIEERSPARIVLRRNESHARVPARLDEVEFRPGLAAEAMAEGFRRGEIDVVRDLRPEELEAVRRLPGAQHVETARRGTCFAVLNAGAPALADERVRRAMAHGLRVPELVWRSIGRLAHPAAGLIPPGMLGHDPGRRFAALSPDEARALVRAAGAPPPKLRAAVHPILLDRHAGFTRLLLEAWADLGVEVETRTSTMAEYIAAWSDGGYDVLVGRYGADYDDPDNFTWGFFHSRHGHLRSWFHSGAFDELAEAARHELRPAVRDALYRRLEGELLREARVVPLFHEIDYRVAGARVRGLELRSTAPYVHYAAVARVDPAAAPAVQRSVTRSLRVNMANTVSGLDPRHAVYVDEVEVAATVFECLTRVTESAQAVPWLAERFEAEEGGRAYRFRLRPDVSFHDGRRLTARDVRWSFERLLMSREALRNRMVLAPIHGARDVMEGRRAELTGFRILSSREFVLELDEPVSYLPTLLSHVPAAIVPEGTGALRYDTVGGCVGTGPFRIVHFEPGRLAELERHPGYWRTGLPRSERLVFRFEVPPAEIVAEFRAARAVIAGELMPADVELLRRRSRYAAACREILGLSTYFVAVNTRRGPLADPVLRRRAVHGLDVSGLVRRHLGRMAAPAQTLIPPGLLGQEPEPPLHAAPAGRSHPPVRRELSAAVHPAFLREYAEFTGALLAAFEVRGFDVRTTTSGWEDFERAVAEGSTDLALSRWFADYPDADNFAGVLLESGTGDVGRLSGSSEIDEIVDRARVEGDPSVRQRLYRELEERLRDEARILPLFHEQAYRFVRPEVEGASLRVCGGPMVPHEDLHVARVPRRVLVVDDDAELREFVAGLLEDAGFGVELAADGAEALERMAQGVDLALLDLKMPNVDGWAVLDHVHGGRLSTPVVAMTGQGEGPGALQAGATAVLPKPFTPSQLLAVCERVLGPG